MLLNKKNILVLLILSSLLGCQDVGVQTSVLTADSQPLLWSDASGYLSKTGQNPSALKQNELLLTQAGPVSRDYVFGAILPSDRVNLLNAISQIKASGGQPYKSIVVLLPTSFDETGNYVFTGENEAFDLETIKKLTEVNLIKSRGQLSQSELDKIPGLSMLKEQFPDSKLIPVFISNKAGSVDAEITAYLLKTYLPEPGLVLAFAEFKADSNPAINEFQQAFTAAVLGNFDFNSLNKLPVENPVILETLGRYLNFQKAGQSTPAQITTADESQNNSASEYFLFKDGVKPNNSRDVYMVIFGDVMLGRYVRTLMNANTLDYPFQKMDQEYLRVNDILLANLEGPIAKNSINTSKSIAFRFMPDVAPLLKKYYFDVLSLANNHTYDMGTNGYKDSREILTKEGIQVFGDPREISDLSVAKVMVQNQKIAFIGLEEVVFKINDEKAVEKIKELVTEGYKVMPVIHWGIEYTHKPNKRQQDLAHKLIDAGAFAIIAHHPHVVQAYETYKGHPVFYSLGNAIFDQYWSAETQEGLSLAMSFNDNSFKIYLLPIKIDRSQMRLMNDDEKKVFLEKFAGYGNFSDAEKQAILNGRIDLTLGT
jgi:poly-gamma-glutamate synthesis protein (capsule biosynthesis protein)